MTRILVQRGGSGSCASSSNPSQNRPTHIPAPPPAPVEDNASESPNEPQVSQEILETAANQESFLCENEEKTADNVGNDLEAKFGEEKASSSIIFGTEKMLDHTSEAGDVEASVYGFSGGNAFLEEGSSHMVHVCPPPPPVPPLKPTTGLSNRRIVSAGSSTPKSSTSRRNIWTVPPSRSSPSGSRPSSPRSIGEEGYNSADEQSPCYNSYYDAERERQFEIDVRRSKGLEVRRMVADGNCLFRAVADQVYGDPEVYDDTRQMCIDYMEKERDHFSQFVTESFIAYCKRKRRDKVYGNNLEIQAMSEMYNRPIHIYSYSTEPINIFHGNYTTDSPPIRLSFHRGNHYNSLVDPHHLTVGAGLGFGSLHGKNIDKDQVKAAIKAQQDQQIENALVAEGRFYSDLELTQQELERMVMEASRNEYIAHDRYKQQYGHKASCTTTNAEPSSSASITGPSREDYYGPFRDFSFCDDIGIPTSVQRVASMGFDHIKVLEAHSIFNDDVEAMVCYLLETSASSPGGESYYRLKGKAAQK